MLKFLYTFAALSAAGSVVLALLPSGSLRRTASMVIGLLALLCWAESFLGLLAWTGGSTEAGSVLAPTAISLTDLQTEGTP